MLKNPIIDVYYTFLSMIDLVRGKINGMPPRNIPIMPVILPEEEEKKQTNKDMPPP